MNDDFFNNPDISKLKEFLLSKKRAPSQISHYLNNKFKHSVLNDMVQSFYGADLNQKLYSIAFDLIDSPKCKCGADLTFKTFSLGYTSFCSTKCASLDTEVIKKTLESRNKKFGTRVLRNVNNSLREARIRERFGTGHPMRNKQVSGKRSETMKIRYGGIGFASTDINAKIENTMIERYGAPRNMHSDILVDKYVKNTLLLEFSKRKAQYSNFEIHREPDDYEGQSQFHLMTCRRCGTQIERNFMHGGPKCPKCDIGVGTSIPERELGDIIKSMLPPETVIIIGAKIFDNPFLSVDFFIPSLKIAFEFNGLYWHSSKFKDKWFHHDKSEQLRKKGIALFHIFEDDFRNRQDIIISMIRQKLNVQSIRVHARKCSIVNLTAKEAREFCERTHLQGFIPGKFYVGLKSNNRIVSVMIVSKSRFNSNFQWELGRWCCELNTSVIGGFSKCLKYVKKLNGNAPILTYCDASHSDGTTYEKFGTLLYHTEPNYFYFKPNTDRESRMKFQKHKLKNLPNYSDDKTEKQIMEENGWKIIYDCGNMVFEL